ncbi:MAG: hypothetical protein ACXVKJ_18465, partial [Ilumatobacteraceae bacterium]
MVVGHLVTGVTRHVERHPTQVVHRSMLACCIKHTRRCLDHTGGNLPFSSTSTIIAHDNVRKRLEAGGQAGNGGSVSAHFDPAPRAALPIITFDHDV